MRLGLRLAAAVALLAAGAATGAAAVGLHRYWWGLALTAVTLLLGLAALPAGGWTRLPAAIGFAGLIGYLVTGRPEGDYLVSSDGRGWTLMAVAFAVVLGAVATLPRSRLVQRRAGGDAAHVSGESRPRT